MSKYEPLSALFQPVLTIGLVCGGIYMWGASNNDISRYIGIVLALVGILSAAFYAKRLHDLPPARQINSPGTDLMRMYMRGALIAAFIPTAITAVVIAESLFAMTNGLAVLMNVFLSIAMLLFPFLFFPFIALIFFEVETALVIALIACAVVRTVMQSMCFLATDKRIDYSGKKLGGVILTALGTVCIVFWFDNLWKVRQFARIELEKGAAAE